MLMISIHAPRTGSDLGAPALAARLMISIHAPRTGSDICFWNRSTRVIRQFQFTLPARGATCRWAAFRRFRPHFNSRSPHGERPDDLRVAVAPQKFQFTLPARGATTCRRIRCARSACDFNSRSPHGERLENLLYPHRDVSFQFTLPARGATARRDALPIADGISIHAPRTGSDVCYDEVM